MHIASKITEPSRVRLYGSLSVAGPSELCLCPLHPLGCTFAMANRAGPTSTLGCRCWQWQYQCLLVIAGVVSPLFRKSLAAAPEPAKAPRQQVHPPPGLVLDHGRLRVQQDRIAKEESGLGLNLRWAGPRESFNSSQPSTPLSVTSKGVGKRNALL